MTRKFALGGDVDLADVSRRCAPQLTGADLYALCADAWMVALKRRIAEQERERRGDGQQPLLASRSQGCDDDEDLYGVAAAEPGGGAAVAPADGAGGVAGGTAGAAGAGGVAAAEGVTVTQSDFRVALANLVPSLSMEEVQKYERLRDHYQGQSTRR